jgi:hypothetical protein
LLRSESSFRWKRETDQIERQKQKEKRQAKLELGEKDYEEGGYCRGEKKE